MSRTTHATEPPRGLHPNGVADVPYRDRDTFVAAGRAAWDAVAALPVASFHPLSSGHRPKTVVRVVHHGDALRLRFDVEDRYVLSRHTRNQDMVCEDSCVEAFIQPRAGGPYFNFEFNCCGVVLCHCVEDCQRGPAGLARSTPLAASALSALTIDATFVGSVWPERQEATAWWLEVEIPVTVLEAQAGPLGPLAGHAFGANFFKCADNSSHPHWASWTTPGAELNFHVPERFGMLRFE